MASLPPLYAHRLGREPGPDSSRAGLAATLVGHVDGLETDVCLTADGELALLHDPWLSGSTTLVGWSHQTRWRELQYARLRNRHGVPTEETPMLLQELFGAGIGELPLQVEIKAHGDPELARATAAGVCRAAQASTCRDQIEVLSFHSAACEEAARHGIAARLVVWADYAPDALAGWARDVGVGGVCIEHFLLHAELVDRLRDDGLSVTTGTINEAALARRAAELGVEAITTDRPDALHAELSQALAA